MSEPLRLKDLLEFPQQFSLYLRLPAPYNGATEFIDRLASNVLRMHYAAGFVHNSLTTHNVTITGGIVDVGTATYIGTTVDDENGMKSKGSDILPMIQELKNYGKNFNYTVPTTPDSLGEMFKNSYISQLSRMPINDESEKVKFLESVKWLKNHLRSF